MEFTVYTNDGYLEFTRMPSGKVFLTAQDGKDVTVNEITSGDAIQIINHLKKEFEI